MPLYEFECDVCKTKKEIMQKINDCLPMCTKCSENGLNVEMKKILFGSRTVFNFKGSGFYDTDYKGK